MASETPNSIVSSGKAYITDLLCEGEIEGLVNNKESIIAINNHTTTGKILLTMVIVVNLIVLVSIFLCS